MPSCLIAQRRTRANNGTPVYEAKCPTIRYPMVLDVDMDQESPGGWTRAGFTIPTAADRYGLVSMTQGADLDLPVWLFEGLTPVFHGTLRKVTPMPNGETTVECDGSYRLLDKTLMRSVWSDTDLSVLTQAPGSASYASMSIDASGRLVFGFPKDHAWKKGDYIAADYFLFGEPVGPRDGKRLDAWKITIGTASTFDNSSLEVRIYGRPSPGDTSQDVLQIFQDADSRMETSDSSHGGDNTSNWPNSSGYRCFRVGLYAAADSSGTPGTDFNAIITQFHVSTAGTRGVGLQASLPSTTAIAKDIWVDAEQGFDLHAYAVEENATTTGGAITGSIADSNQKAYGINYTDWTQPRQMLDDLAATDGRMVGMWGPTKTPQGSALMVAAGNTAANYWYRQPAELTYEAWSPLSQPDYHVRLGRGAIWEPDGVPDELVTSVYVTYQSLKGQPLSVFFEDATSENLAFEQGLHKAELWQIDPSVDTQTASTLAAAFAEMRRQPFLSGSLTVFGDRPGAIELPGGAQCRLCDLRLGVLRIVDAQGPKAGRITAITYKPRSASEVEQAVLTVNSPAAQLLELQVARAARRAAHRRNR